MHAAALSQPIPTYRHCISLLQGATFLISYVHVCTNSQIFAYRLILSHAYLLIAVSVCLSVS